MSTDQIQKISQCPVAVDETVHVGTDGWLFLVKGTNNVSNLYKHASSFTKEMTNKWVLLLQERQSKLASFGIKYVHLPAPEKLSVLSKYYNGKIENINGSPINQLFKMLPPTPQYAINPLPFFSQQIDKVPLYWKTDTHWSFWGCFSAYQLLCSKLGVPFNQEILNYPYTPVNMVLDLGSKVEPKIKEKARYYKLNKHSIRTYANSLVEFKEKHGLANEGSLHVGSQVVFNNKSESAIDSVIVLFGDSFSEFRHVLLTGMLAETFREVHFIWAASIDYDYVQRIKPDYVVTELAERFMTRVPEDNLNIEEFALSRIQAYKSSNTL